MKILLVFVVFVMIIVSLIFVLYFMNYDCGKFKWMVWLFVVCVGLLVMLFLLLLIVYKFGWIELIGLLIGC